MSKKGRLSKAEEYCIEKMAIEEKPAKEIAEFLDRSESTVANWIKKHIVEVEKEEEEEEKPKKKNQTMFINRTAAKGDKAVSIMTPMESSRGETTRGQRVGGNKKIERSTHTIHEE